MSDSQVKYIRRKTVTVNIGGVPMGGNYPVRIQSMTNTDTNNIDASVAQCIRIINAGADYVRLTVQGLREAESLKQIKNILREKGFSTPVIADVHFNPLVAEECARIADKVRINPGNFGGHQNDVNADFPEESFKSLLDICKQHNTALRIGVNHGSLSQRIMNLYGDTPRGMVVSALEYLRICVKEKFGSVVLSMKSSNTILMVHAYRMLVDAMDIEEMKFPLHLGVTEAGSADDGRIKSAVGIAALLCDGIGDTIRISLTEEPEREIPVAKEIIDCCAGIKNAGIISKLSYGFERRKSNKVLNIGNNNPPVVISSGSTIYENTNTSDYLFLQTLDKKNHLPLSRIILPFPKWLKNKETNVLYTSNEYFMSETNSMTVNFIQAAGKDLSNTSFLEKCTKDPMAVLVLNDEEPAMQRKYIYELMEKNISVPVVCRCSYKEKDFQPLIIKSSCGLGPLLIDGLVDGVWIEDDNHEQNNIAALSFDILQASRARIYKTEFISCPGCGRTSFDIQNILAEVKVKLGHLKGLKIAVMGCIVNGPGEMADADYGYVGAVKGTVILYRRKQMVHKNIPEESAVDLLIDMIKSDRLWKEKS